jgi:hypothetical protein
MAAKRIRLLVALSVLASAWSVMTPAPAHACFNPDEPTCQIAQAFCYNTESVAKYRDKFIYCW